MKYKKNPHRCPFNGAVVCDDQTGCARCGWNPKIEEERLHRITQERKKRRISDEYEKKMRRSAKHGRSSGGVKYG